MNERYEKVKLTVYLKLTLLPYDAEETLAELELLKKVFSFHKMLEILLDLHSAI